MNSDWKAFLLDQGANLADDGVADFGDPQAELAAAEADVLCDLSHYGLIRVGGADATQFLQGQFSNDVRQVGPERAQLSSYCSPKGRMLATLLLFQRDGDYYLRLPGLLAGDVGTRLRKYVLMSKVVIADAGDELARFGIAGAAAADALAAAWGELPAEVDAALSRDGVTVLRVAGAPARFEVYGDAAALAALWAPIAAVARPAGADVWALLEVRAGVPTVLPETVEAFVPQMANLQLVGGVSFRKGCYPGQEVVARMQYLGNLKRRMYLAHAEADARPAPGTELFSPNSDSGQGAGKVVDARPAPGGGFDILAVVQIECAENNPVHLGGADGPQLRFRDLPYTFAEGADVPKASTRQ